MAPSRFARGWVLAALWSSFWSSIAAGQTAPPAPDTPALETSPATADALIEKGISQRKAGDDRGALESFQRAYELGGSPRALAQLALAEQALGRWLDAHEHMTRALARDHSWIREHADELRAALDDIASELGSLEVSCDVDGAEIYVDGRRVGTTPSPNAFRIVAGESVIQVVAPGYFSLTRQVQVEAGGLSRVEVRLTPRTSEQEREPGRDAAAGSASGPGAREPAAGPGPWRDALMYGSLGFSGLGVATGITGYVMREVNVKVFNDDDRCDTNPLMPRSEECPDAASAWRLGENLTIGGFVVAGVFGALGLYLWLERPEGGGSAVACRVDVGALTCGGTF